MSKLIKKTKKSVTFDKDTANDPMIETDLWPDKASVKETLFDSFHYCAGKRALELKITAL
jgi:hypothetical protein